MRGTWDVTLKTGKSWSKATTTVAPVDEITVVEEGDGKAKGKEKKAKGKDKTMEDKNVEIRMEIVVRMEKAIAPAERRPIQQRFEKEWAVPVYS